MHFLNLERNSLVNSYMTAKKKIKKMKMKKPFSAKLRTGFFTFDFKCNTLEYI